MDTMTQQVARFLLSLPLSLPRDVVGREWLQRQVIIPGMGRKILYTVAQQAKRDAAAQRRGRGSTKGRSTKGRSNGSTSTAAFRNALRHLEREGAIRRAGESVHVFRERLAEWSAEFERRQAEYHEGDSHQATLRGGDQPSTDRACQYCGLVVTKDWLREGASVFHTECAKRASAPLREVAGGLPEMGKRR